MKTHSLQQRCDFYAQAFPWPPPHTNLDETVWRDGDRWLSGMWVLGNDYKRTSYYGSYPPNFVRRVMALFPDAERVLHLFSGSLPKGNYVRFHCREGADVVGDAHKLAEHFGPNTFDLILADPLLSFDRKTETKTKPKPIMNTVNSAFKARLANRIGANSPQPEPRSPDQDHPLPCPACEAESAPVLDGAAYQTEQTEKGTYLSIDLDFWAHSQVDSDFIRRVIRRVGAENFAAAVHHDSILPHLRRYGEVCDVLINLDRHSDLGGVVNVMFEDGDTDNRRLELHSGSWGDYVAWPVRRRFLWAYPEPKCREQGRCDAFSNHMPFNRIPQRDEGMDDHSRLDPPWDYKWRTLHRNLARPPYYGVALGALQAGSITLSPAYCGPDAVGAFKTLIREFDLELLDLLPCNLDALKRVVRHL